ncbi:MAG TPA: DUF4142 domain-containing protein [Allosphingosinicella sp.]
MRAFLLAAGAALLTAACATTAGEDMAENAGMPPSGMPAPEYVQTAASGDQFEIQSGQMALQRSCDPAVRSFAQMIVDDHRRMSGQMMQAAQSAGLPPPPMQMAPHHQDMLQRLQASGPGFEAAFRDAQIMAHQEALELHRGFAEEGDEPALQGVASQAVPAIQMHLSQAQNLPATARCAAPAPEPVERRRGERG